MTIDTAVTLALTMRTTTLERATLEDFLTELEQNIAVEVRGEDPAALSRPRKVLSANLAVPAPFDRLYWMYLVSMIDLAAGSETLYALSSARYREARAEYARWYQRTGRGNA